MNTNQHSGVQAGFSCHWLDVLEKKNVGYMVLDPQHDTKLIEQLKTRSGWIVEFTDEEAIFFVREEIAVSY